MKKKVISMILAAAMTAVMAAGCGGSANNTAEGEAQTGDAVAESEEETEIDGITCQIICKNGDGSELYSQTYEAAE